MVFHRVVLSALEVSDSFFMLRHQPYILWIIVCKKVATYPCKVVCIPQHIVSAFILRLTSNLGVTAIKPYRRLFDASVFLINANDLCQGVGKDRC